MAYARKALVSLQDTPYYHVIGKCVRHAWLWGINDASGKDYSHRKAWVLKRLELLSQVFAVDVCAYAVLSNHFHLVIHIDQKRALSWTAADVVERWSQLFSIPDLVKDWLAGESTPAERQHAEKLIEQWRSHLYSISWFMRCFREPLARRANIEDQVTGHFWTARFKSQALLDEKGLLTAMAYVDLNPIRAGIAATPETSDYTSIQARIEAVMRASNPVESPPATSIELLPFADEHLESPHLPFTLKDYLALVDWSGRQIRRDKCSGHIAAEQPPIFNRLKIDDEAWQRMMVANGNRFGRAIGPLDRLRTHAKTVGQCWIRGLLVAREMYQPS